MGRERKRIYFNEKEVLTASKILKEIKLVSGFLNVLMDRDSNTFSCIIICNPNKGFKEILIEQKRDSDIVIEISEEMGLYYVIAQETDEIGATKFLKRLYKVGKEKLNNNADPYAAVLSVRSKRDKDYIVFRLIQEFIFFSKQDLRFRIDGIITSSI